MQLNALQMTNPIKEFMVLGAANEVWPVLRVLNT